jgi:hypothetical protein
MVAEEISNDYWNLFFGKLKQIPPQAWTISIPSFNILPEPRPLFLLNLKHFLLYQRNFLVKLNDISSKRERFLFILSPEQLSRKSYNKFVMEVEYSSFEPTTISSCS